MPTFVPVTVLPSGPAASHPTSAGAPVVRTVRLPVQRPTVTDVAPQDRVENQANGGIVITTSRDADHPLHLEWVFDPVGLPSGAMVSQVETRVCGHGGGDFYEVYGPNDSDPVEYEVKPPAADGCWHFLGGPSDWNVSIYVYGDATMTIDRIEMTIAADR